MWPEQLTLEVESETDAALRARWKSGAARLHFGLCARWREENGRPLLVARQEHCRLVLCFRCWQARTRPRRRYGR